MIIRVRIYACMLSAKLREIQLEEAACTCVSHYIPLQRLCMHDGMNFNKVCFHKNKVSSYKHSFFEKSVVKENNTRKFSTDLFFKKSWYTDCDQICEI